MHCQTVLRRSLKSMKVSKVRYKCTFQIVCQREESQIRE